MIIEPPKDMIFKVPPLQHQLQCLARTRDLPFSALLCEMGTGKSAMLIQTASWLFSQGKINGLVIICPKSVCRTWAEQQLPAYMPDNIEMLQVLWGPHSKAFEAQLKHLFSIAPLKLKVLIMNVDAVITDRGYDLLEKFLRSHDTLLTVDESTSIKNYKSSRTKILTKLGKLAKYRRILTGTPIANRPLDIFSQFRFLDENCLGTSNFFAFRNRYAVTRTRYLAGGKKFEEIIGWQRLDELQRIIAGPSFRVLKQDCLDLPEKIYQKRYIELAAEQKKYYEELRDEALTELSSGSIVSAPLMITRILRLRQSLCNLAPSADSKTEFITKSDHRLNEVMNIIDESGDQKIIIWSCFTPSILKIVDAINKEYGDGYAAAFYGDVTEKRRQELIDEFQTDGSKLRVLVLQPRTGGEGITLTKASIVIYHDNDWSLKVRLQTEDRAHRIGQVKNVTYIDLIAQETIDEIIVDSLRMKKDLAGLVTGDDLRGMLQAA